MSPRHRSDAAENRLRGIEWWALIAVLLIGIAVPVARMMFS